MFVDEQHSIVCVCDNPVQHRLRSCAYLKMVIVSDQLIAKVSLHSLCLVFEINSAMLLLFCLDTALYGSSKK